MSNILWPPLSPGSQPLQAAYDATTARELAWLVEAAQDTLRMLKSGLDECAALLEPRESGATLVLSSQRSESLKGFVTLNGTRIVKGDVQLRLNSLPPPRGQPSLRLTVSAQSAAPTLVVPQLVQARTLINACLDVVDATCWAGDTTNAHYISSQFRLLAEHIQDARQALLGGTDHAAAWNKDPVDRAAFDPPLPSTLSLYFHVADAALVLAVRTLEPVDPISGAATPTSTYSAASGGGGAPSFSGLRLRDRLAAALGAPLPPTHDEAEEMFMFRGQKVRVREKLRIETQDPSLMAALAKLGALEHSVALMRRALNVVMGVEAGDDADD